MDSYPVSMKKLFLSLIVLALATVWAWGQSVTFSKLPANLQLYPRDAQNKATVPVAGRITTTGYTRISLWVYRNNLPYKYQTQPLNYANGVAAFSFNTDIKAELAEYNFKVYACKSKDSSQVALRESIVAGDVYLISGQSNASAGLPGYNYQNKFARTFGTFTNNDNYEAYNSKDTLWTFSNQAQAVVGVWGTELQRQIIEKYGIPVCIINGASGGSSIEYNIIRNAENPTDPNTTYGRLLYRVQKSGLKDHIKAIFWRQGENECSGNSIGYPGNFDKLYNFWKQDYPAAQKVYVFQVNILSFPLETAGKYVRDFQRRVKGLYPNIETVATVGTTGYDGVHYQIDGHKQISREVFCLISRDFYGNVNQIEINSPNIKKAYYTSSAKNEIALEFDERIIWPGDTLLLSKTGQPYVRKMEDFFYLGGKAGLVEWGSAQGNTLYLKLKQATNETKITYLPAYFSDALSDFYNGPVLRTPKGMRAMVFYDFPVGNDKNDKNSEEDIVIPLPPLPPAAAIIANMALTGGATNQSPKVGEELECSIAIWNDGPANATNVKLRGQLPTGLAFASSNDFKNLGNGNINSEVALVAPGTYVILKFKVKVLALGTWPVKVEIMASDDLDLNSIPGNGFDNDEDDQVSINIKAAETSPDPVVPTPVIPIVVQKADLSLLMDVNDRFPTIGDVVTYAVVVKNDGPATATGIEIKSILPNELSFVSSNDFTYQNGLTLASVSTLASGAIKVLRFQAKLKNTGLIWNKAEISKADQLDPDSTPNNGTENAEDDRAAVDVQAKEVVVPPTPTPVTPAPVIAKADLSLQMDVNDPKPIVGNTVTYHLTVKNGGTASATGVEVKNILPDGLEMMSSSSFSAKSSNWIAAMTSIPSGDSLKLSFTAKVKKAGVLSNKAEISKSDQLDPDSTPDNGMDNSEDDHATVSIASVENTTVPPINPTITDPLIPIIIQEKADLSLLMSVDNPTPKFGEEVTFFMVLKNDGPNTAYNVGFRDALPDGLTFVSSNLLASNNGILEATLFSLSSGAEFLLTFKAKITQAGGVIVNKSQISKSNQFDPDSIPGNGTENKEDDTASVTLTVPPSPCSALKCVPFLVSKQTK